MLFPVGTVQIALNGLARPPSLHDAKRLGVLALLSERRLLLLLLLERFALLFVHLCAGRGLAMAFGCSQCIHRVHYTSK